MKVTTEIPLQRVSDLLCNALEGGSNYWYEIVGYVKPSEFTFNPSSDLDKDPDKFKHLSYPVNPGGALLIKSTEEPRKHAKRLDLESIERGLTLMANTMTYAHHWVNFLKENDDAETGDVFLQFCLFGEVIYG